MSGPRETERRAPAGGDADLIREVNQDMTRDGPDPAPERHGRDLNTGDLFAWGAKQRRFDDAGSVSPPPSRQSKSAFALETSSRRYHRDRRLRRYLASGSFGRRRDVDDDHPVLRNRILFVILLLLIIAFIAGKTLTR
jgi:hypothetical protein